MEISIKPEDMETLTTWATSEWRNPDQQAAALLEREMRAYRAKSDPNATPRRPRSRRNGGTT